MERRVVTVSAVAAIAAFGMGCASNSREEYRNEARPPTPEVVTAAIAEDGVTISPQTLGAGPVEVIVTNQTEGARELTLETNEIGGTEAGIETSTGSINPGDTASLKADLRTGEYQISVDGGQGTALRVGGPRPSAQNELATP